MLETFLEIQFCCAETIGRHGFGANGHWHGCLEGTFTTVKPIRTTFNDSLTGRYNRSLETVLLSETPVPRQCVVKAVDMNGVTWLLFTPQQPAQTTVEVEKVNGLVTQHRVRFQAASLEPAYRFIESNVSVTDGEVVVGVSTGVPIDPRPILTVIATPRLPVITILSDGQSKSLVSNAVMQGILERLATAEVAIQERVKYEEYNPNNDVVNANFGKIMGSPTDKTG